MILRWFVKYSLGPANPGLIGNKETRMYSEKVLQFWNDKEQKWMDVPIERNITGQKEVEKARWKR